MPEDSHSVCRNLGFSDREKKSLRTVKYVWNGYLFEFFSTTKSILPVPNTPCHWMPNPHLGLPVLVLPTRFSLIVTKRYCEKWAICYSVLFLLTFSEQISFWLVTQRAVDLMPAKINDVQLFQMQKRFLILKYDIGIDQWVIIKVFKRYGAN